MIKLFDKSLNLTDWSDLDGKIVRVAYQRPRPDLKEDAMVMMMDVRTRAMYLLMSPPESEASQPLRRELRQ